MDFDQIEKMFNSDGRIAKAAGRGMFSRVRFRQGGKPRFPSEQIDRRRHTDYRASRVTTTQWTPAQVAAHCESIGIR